MFADNTSNLMLILLFFFAGLVVMFVFITRHLDILSRHTEEMRKQLNVSLMDLERSIAELSYAVKANNGSATDFTSEPLPAVLPPAPENPGGALAQMEDLAELFEHDMPEKDQA